MKLKLALILLLSALLMGCGQKKEDLLDTAKTVDSTNEVVNNDEKGLEVSPTVEGTPVEEELPTGDEPKLDKEDAKTEVRGIIEEGTVSEINKLYLELSNVVGKYDESISRYNEAGYKGNISESGRSHSSGGRSLGSNNATFRETLAKIVAPQILAPNIANFQAA